MSVEVCVKNLTKTLEGEVPVTLVRDINLEIKKGEFVVITGPSGSGKSSLLYLLGLLDRPTKGHVWIKDIETSTCSQEELSDIRRSKMGFVFQFHFLLPEFTALENVMLPMQRLGILSEKEIKIRAEELLISLGLAAEIYKFPKQLSGGQSQRVSVARAFANNPSLILADEPTGNLDSVSSKNVQEIMKDLATQHGRTVIVVTHDPEFAKTADRIIEIVDGKLV